MSENHFPAEERQRLLDQISKLESERNLRLQAEEKMRKAFNRVDEELSRIRIFQDFVASALAIENESQLIEYSLETVIEAYETEKAAFFLAVSGKNLRLAGGFGLDDIDEQIKVPLTAVPENKMGLLGNDSSTRHISDMLQLKEGILCSFSGKESQLGGMVVTGNSADGVGIYRQPSEEHLSSFAILSAQIGALWINRHLMDQNREYTQQLEIHRAKLEERVAERTAELKEKVKELKKLSLAVEQSPVSIIMTDVTGTIEYVNPKFVELTGYSREEVLGENPRILNSGTQPKDFYEEMWETILGGNIWQGEFCNMKKNGEIYWENASLSPISNDREEITHFVAVKEDITERRRLQRELVKAKEAAEETLEIISSSISYASHIQHAILPDNNLFSAWFKNYFVIWEPRDVVGGDIYWSVPWNNGLLLALGDCTGHGVPGAFMTLITTAALDRSKSEIKDVNISQVVQRMHQIVQKSLGQHEKGGGSDDGMELGLCYFNADMTELVYVGARFPMFIVEDETITVIKGDKKAIGYRNIPFFHEYIEQRIPLKAGQRVYLTTDGLIDQIGGPKQRSYGKKRFKNLILSLSDVPFAEHGTFIYKDLIKYQGKEMRRDDVSLFGFQIN